MSNLFEQLAQLPIVSIDIEGDGGQPPRIVEISTVKLEKMQISDDKTWLLDPGRPIASYAQKVHGIRDVDVESAPRLSQIEGEVKRIISGKYLLAHNASVEISVLSRSFPDWQPVGVIDTLKLSRMISPRMSSHKLGSLINHYDIESQIGEKAATGPHRAFYDALATIYLFFELVAEAAEQGLPIAKIAIVPDSGEEDEAPQMELF